MATFTLPAGMPRAADVYNAILSAIDEACSSPDQQELCTAAREYVQSLKAGTGLHPNPVSAADNETFAKWTAEVKAVHDKHDLPGMDMRRFKLPSGSLSAPFACHLFFPPSSNPLSQRHILVEGPDTTHRFLAAGMTTASLTTDYYAYSTQILHNHQFTNRAFDRDPTLTVTAARELFDVLTRQSKTMYIKRLAEPGVDVVWGGPVRDAHERACSNKPSGWQSLNITVSIDVPGISNECGTFDSGDTSVSAVLRFQRKPPGGYQFGKIVLYHAHPCAPLAKAHAGVRLSYNDWRTSAMTDALVDLVIQGSTGSPSGGPQSKTFAFATRPNPVYDKDVDFMTVSAWRAYEKQQNGLTFSKADLPEAVVAYVERHYDIVETSPGSFLFKAVSAATSKSASTRRLTPSTEFPGLSVAQAARLKGNETRRNTPSLADPSISALQESALKSRDTRRVTPSLEIPGLSVASAMMVKGNATRKNTPSLDDPSVSMATVSALKSVETRRNTPSTDMPGLSVAAAARQKAIQTMRATVSPDDPSLTALNLAAIKATETKHNTLSKEMPGLTVASASAVKMNATKRSTMSAENPTMTVMAFQSRKGADKRMTTASSDLPGLTIAQATSKKGLETKRNTPSATDPSISLLSDISLRAWDTKRKTQSASDPSFTVAQVQVQRAVATRKTKRAADDPDLTIQQSSTKKMRLTKATTMSAENPDLNIFQAAGKKAAATRKATESFEKFCVRVQKAYERKDPACRTPAIDLSDPRVKEYYDMLQAYKVANPKTGPEQCGPALVRKLRSDLFGGQRAGKPPMAELLEGWPAGVPYNPNVDGTIWKVAECAYLGAAILRGDIRVKQKYAHLI